MHARLQQNGTRWSLVVVATAMCGWLMLANMAVAQVPFSLNDFAQSGARQTEALKVNEAIYQATGFSNTFLVVTSEGNVVIDTSSVLSAKKHFELLQKVSKAPTKYVVLTHGHEDHTGGVSLWRGEGTHLVAQAQFTAFRRYQQLLGKYFARSNAAQFGLEERMTNAFTDTPRAPLEPDVLFDDRYEFEVGGVKFELQSAPGETYDHLLVWVPQYRAVFVGDNFYDSFPNIYTLRGTKPRWALDYVESLNKVLALEPEIMLPSHGQPVRGADKVRERVTRYRDAILHVHDAVIAGMNAGNDVYTLMREIRLPAELDVGEGYGKVAWSVRGIYEGYVGWFDLNPASMFGQPATLGSSDLVELAGGPAAVVSRARQVLEAGDPLRALRLADAAEAVEPANRPALELQLAALQALQKQSRNLIEHAWLSSGIRRVQRALSGKDQPAAESSK